MANEGGEWIMKGLDWDDPLRIRSWRELINEKDINPPSEMGGTGEAVALHIVL